MKEEEAKKKRVELKLDRQKKIEEISKKNQELADKIKIEARSQKVKKNEKNQGENKKVEAKIIQTEVFEELENADIEKNLVQKKINEKILLKELAEQRNKEIQKRKYSYFNNESISKDIEVDNTKYFFDEGIVDKLSQQKTSKQEIDEKLVKKKLQKKKKIIIIKIRNNLFQKIKLFQLSILNLSYH